MMDCESAVITSCLIDKKQLSRIQATGMKAEWFVDSVNRRVWIDMVDRVESGKIANLMWADDLAHTLGSASKIRYSEAYADMLLPNDECMSAVQIMKQRAGRKEIQDIWAKINSRIEVEDPEILAKELIENTSCLISKECKESNEDLLGKIRCELDVGMVCPTGYSQLDYYVYGIEPGVLHMVGGHTSHCKTNFVLNIAYNLLKSEHAVTFFSAEMPRKELIKRLATMESGINPPPHSVTEEEKETFMLGAKKALTLPLNIYQTLSLPEIRMKVENRASELYIVDYIQMIDPHVREDNEVKRLGHIVRQLSGLSKENNVCIIATSQFNRATGTGPTLQSFRASGEIEESTDIGILLYYPYQQVSRDEQEKMKDEGTDRTVNVDVAKNRIHGRCGRVKFDFDRHTLRMKEIEKQGRNV
jgi:replicative DNA helicase